MKVAPRKRLRALIRSSHTGQIESVIVRTREGVEDVHLEMNEVRYDVNKAGHTLIALIELSPEWPLKSPQPSPPPPRKHE